MFFSRTYARLLRPGLAQITDSFAPARSPLRVAFDRLQSTIDQRCEDLKLSAMKLDSFTSKPMNQGL